MAYAARRYFSSTAVAGMTENATTIS